MGVEHENVPPPPPLAQNYLNSIEKLFLIHFRPALWLCKYTLFPFNFVFVPRLKILEHIEESG